MKLHNVLRFLIKYINENGSGTYIITHTYSHALEFMKSTMCNELKTSAVKLIFEEESYHRCKSISITKSK